MLQSSADLITTCLVLCRNCCIERYISVGMKGGCKALYCKRSECCVMFVNAS